MSSAVAEDGSNGRFILISESPVVERVHPMNENLQGGMTSQTAFRMET